MKTGFLLPRSTVYPLIGHDFLNGIKSYLAYSKMTADILTDNIGFGFDEKEVYSKNEAMLLGGNADIVVAFIDGRCAEMLQPLYSATGKILLLVNMGTDMPEAAPASSTVIQHSFNVSLNSYLTGMLAADQHQRALMATSFYDGGYLHCYSMVAGYQQQGGAISNNFISHFKKDEFTTEPLKQYLANTPEEDTLLCLYSGDVAHLIYRALAEVQQQKELFLYVSPMMLDETLADLLGKDFSIKNTKGYTSWLSALDNESNRNFKAQYHQLAGRNANLFSLLGWETGILLKEINELAEQGLKGTVLVEEMKKKELDSPRGWLKINEQTQQTYSPAYLVSVTGNYEMAIASQFETRADTMQQFISARPEGASSGWKNTYLCS